MSVSVRFRDVEAEVDRLLGEIGPRAVLSFDVFDTLVHRRCSREFVKDHVAHRLAGELGQRGLRAARGLFDARVAAETELFKAASSCGDDPEFHITDRNRRWVELVVGDQLDDESSRQLAGWLETVEVEAEVAAVVANAELHVALQRLRSRARRVVFASDMYLGEQHVRTILDACGYQDVFDRGYVSGDLKLYKATGRMFQFLAEAEDVTTGEVVHVGDLFAADHEGPASVGVRTVWIDDPALVARRLREEQDHEAVLADRRTLPVIVDRFVHEGLGEAHSFAESYGRALFGPIFTNFVHHVAVGADEAGVSALFFLSRDGFAFRRIYEAMCEQVWATSIPHLPSRYICLSRLPVLRAMLQDGMSLKALMSAKNHLVFGSRTVGNTFASLGLDPAMVASLAKRHGVDPAGFFHDGLLHAPPFLNLLNDRELTRHARKVGNAAANLVRDYLRQEGLFDFQRIGLVDIGWGATIQDQLRDCIMDEPDCPTMLGYYFGGNESLYDRRTPDNWMEAISASVFTPERELALGNAATFSFVGLMEEAARAPHGTCVGYERRGEQVSPNLRTDGLRRAETAAEPVIARMQAGAVDYGREYATAVELLALGPHETRALANTALQRLVMYPERREIDLWQSVHHTNDVGGTFEIDEVLVAPAQPAWRRLLHWRRSSRASMWTFGSIRYLIGWPGLALYNLGWSASKARNVQRPMNARRFTAPYYFTNESRRPPPREPGKLEESAVYLAASAKADASVLGYREPGLHRVTIFSPLLAVGSAAVVKANRLLPHRLYASFAVVNDGIPVTYLLSRGVKAPVQVRLDRHPALRRSVGRVLRAVSRGS